MLRLLLMGHGRMGRLVESLAASHDCEIVAVMDGASRPDALGALDAARVDVAVDFSVPAAVPVNLPVLAERGVNVVIGTTGWQAHEPALREVVARTGIGVLASANFALGLVIFSAAVAEAARQFASQPDAGAWIHEAHHSAKKDAPSGTALWLRAAVERAGYGRTIDVASTRAGSIPGTHTVGFDLPAESVTFTHTVRDRSVFARGALAGAHWLAGRRGWFTIDDMIRSSSSQAR